MITEIYDALREAGASEEKARRAAESLTGSDERFGKLEQRIGALEQRIVALSQAFAEFRGEVLGRFAAIEARFTAFQWVMGFMAAAEVAILAKLFVHP